MENSDLLIHLVDASSEHVDNHIASVEKILDELHLSEIPRLLVLNKSDLLNADALENMTRAYNAVAISALNRESLLPMVERVGEMLNAALTRRDHQAAAEEVEPAVIH
jgi:GTP-binding protein HflX